MTGATDQELCAAFVQIGSSDASDAGAVALHPGLRRIGDGDRLCGIVRTAHCAPGDNLGLLAAAVAAAPGEVIVAVGGGEDSAVVGELMSLRAKARGAAGFIVDGYARDAAALALPTFARGTHPRKPQRERFLSLQEPVEIQGVTVAPGDIVIADADGIALVPRSRVDAILAEATAVLQRNAEARAAITSGEDLVRVRAALARKP